MLDADQACIRCSYNLRGLPVAGRCPECGTPVADSLRGTLLQYAAPEYLATIHAGLRLVLFSILASVAFMVIGIIAGIWMPGLSGFELLLQGVNFIIVVVAIVGYWRFTTPDPLFAGQEKPDAARKVARAAVAVQAAMAAVSFIVAFSGGGAVAAPGPGAPPGALLLFMIGMIAGLVSLVGFAVQFFSIMRYTRWLGRRVPDDFLIRRSGTYLWLLPVIAIVGLVAMGLGPLIALVMYWNLLDRLQKHLKSIRATGSPAALKRMAPREPLPAPVVIEGAPGSAG